MPWSAEGHTRLCLAGRPYPMRLREAASTGLTHRTVQVISNGDLLCFHNKGSCRRSFDASSQGVAFDEYSTGLLILAPTLSEMFVQMMLWPWSNAKSSYEAPSQTPWIHCREMGRQTMQVISNGGLLCSGNKGSCRRSFDALVRRTSHSAMSSWPSLSNALKGSRFTGWPAPVPMRLTHRTVQVISNGTSSVFITRGRADRALMVSIQVYLFLNTRSRPGPKSGVGCRLTTLLILLHCQVSHGVRVPALSVGAGEGNFLAYPRRLQVPKLNGEQVTDGKQEPTHQVESMCQEILCASLQ